MKKENLKADLVIVGGGGAGLAAAVAAAEKGTSVVVLEKRNCTGGNTALASGLFAAESPVQKRAMVDASADELFGIMMDWAHWRIDPRIIRAFIDKSGDTIRWLEEMGCAFQLAPFYANQVPLVLHRQSRKAIVTDALRKRCNTLNVTIFTRTGAEKIFIAPNGEIAGVLASNGDQEFTIATKGVVIATGGYGGNKEWIKRYSSHYHDTMLCLGLPNMGDGLRMAVEAGAATEGLGMLQIEGPWIPRSVRLMIDAGDSERVAMSLMQVAVEPYAIWVNKNGRRFIDETLGYSPFVAANGVALQPDGVCYALLDDTMIEMMTKTGIVIAQAPAGQLLGSGVPGLERELRLQAEAGVFSFAQVNNDLCNGCGICINSCPIDIIRLVTTAYGNTAEIAPVEECRLCQACERVCPRKAISVRPAKTGTPFVKISDSWEQIADWIGVGSGTLKQTIEEYNTACHTGHDPVFAKDRRYLMRFATPPYYAIRCNVHYIDTVGGIKINERMEVVSKEGRPLPGFYAAGIDTGGWIGDTYDTRTSGTTFAFAINSGRIAGENAVAFLKKDVRKKNGP
jgi:fumarate reductase flavoprotein subunit